MKIVISGTFTTLGELDRLVTEAKEAGADDTSPILAGGDNGVKFGILIRSMPANRSNSRRAMVEIAGDDDE